MAPIEFRSRRNRSMRRSFLAAAAVGGLALTTGLFLRYAPVTAQSTTSPIPADVAPGKASANQLPIGQVILFSSGVGYFQREGEILGSTRVDLSFPVQDINDLLKSMVLQDLGGGHVTAVSYDSQAPVEKT